MALLIAIVGGIGLMGTISMNVLERTREIGVLRSIGASNSAIVLALAALASVLPAWNAVRLMVRDVLAYE
jgi:putative ABC transport system permease protein